MRGRRGNRTEGIAPVTDEELAWDRLVAAVKAKLRDPSDENVAAVERLEKELVAAMERPPAQRAA